MEGTEINFEILYTVTEEERKETFKIEETQEQRWLKPLWEWKFESEEALNLAAYMWYFYEGKNVDTFKVLYESTLRLLGQKIPFTD